MSEHAVASIDNTHQRSHISTQLSSTQLSSRNYDEKRDFIRMRINSEAIIINEAGEKTSGFCHNLSGGGALVELGKALTVNEQVEVIIHSQYGHAPVFSSKGAVIRNQLLASKASYLIAIKY